MAFKGIVHHEENETVVINLILPARLLQTGKKGSGARHVQVLNCLSTEHDWRLVLLGAVVCLLASAVAISLFHRARASSGRTRLIWLGLDAAVSGCGIWATHFIAMLAYDPGNGAGYSI